MRSAALFVGTVLGVLALGPFWKFTGVPCLLLLLAFGIRVCKTIESQRVNMNAGIAKLPPLSPYDRGAARTKLRKPSTPSRL